MPPPIRDSTPCRHKASSFCTILRYPFLVSDPKNFLKAPLTPIYTNFEGAARFLVHIFQKVSKNACFWLFFQNYAIGAENLTETESF